MSIVLDGTKGVSASGGLYAANTFTGTYTDGIVVDYINGNGRISVGAADGLTFYNNGVANNALVTLDVYGRLTVNGGDNGGLWPTTSPGLYFQRTQSSAESNIPFIRAESDASTTNLLLGTSSSSGVVKFITGSSLLERMRLDANGNLLVGTTSASAKVVVYQSGSGVALDISAGTTTAGTAVGVFTKGLNSTATSNVLVQFNINGGTAGSGQINANGANAAAFGTYSDIRLKENIGTLSNQLANICALKPSEFDYKDGSGHQIGFIAQEMQEVYPDAVGEDENGMLTITGWSKTEARLVKAIQELTTRLEDSEAKNTELENRIAALENK